MNCGLFLTHSTAAMLSVLAALANAHQIERATYWEWAEGSTAPAQSCSTDTFVWPWDDESPGRAYYEDYGLYGTADGRYGQGSLVLPHDVAVTRIDDTGTHRTALAYLIDEGDGGPRPYLPVNSLRQVGHADEAWLETTVSTWETYYNGEAVVSLILQWLRHWCVDEDGDDRCDRIENPKGSTAADHLWRGIFPPMRAAERAELAQCLEQHDSQKLQTVRREYQIAGAANWPRELLWTADCPRREAPDKPTAATPLQGSEAPSDRQACALFHQFLGFGTPARWFLGDGSEPSTLAYICDPSLSPRDSQGAAVEETGHSIRYLAGRVRGAFPGFQCPEVAKTSSTSPTADAMRFDTTGLRGPQRRNDEAERNPLDWRVVPAPR